MVFVGVGGFRMQTQEPADRDQPAPADGAQTTSAVTLAPDAPPPSNETMVLWTTFLGMAAVFIVVFVFILRSRIGGGGVPARAGMQAKPPKPEKKAKRQRKGARHSDFFQPAGEGAEITFDEPPVTAKKQRGIEPEEIAPAPQDGEAQVIIERESQADEPPLSAAPAETPADDFPVRRISPFAGLFAKRKRDEAENAPPREPAKEPVVESPAPEKPRRFNPFSERPAFAKPYVQRAEEPEEEAIAAAEEEERLRAFEEQERERALEDARREEERRRAADRRLVIDREAEFERRKQAAFDARQREMEERERAIAARAASMDSHERELRRDLSFELDERFQALADRLESSLRQREGEGASDGSLRSISMLSREIDDRFTALSERLESRIAAQAALRGGAAANDDRFVGADDLVARRIAEHRAAIDETLAAISSRIDDIAGAPVDVKSLRTEIAGLKRALSERASGPAAPLIQLSDIVRNALPPNAYEMRAMLPNNRKADCVIKLAHPPGPIAIDARFPVEAFHRLQEAPEGKERAENEFRRVALRHIVDIAERLIIADETAESALMFIPSESMYAELHARFPDVVQDSYRARVWIVSPTTLMATLHTMRAVLRDAHARESADLIQSEAQHVLAEVDSLRRRVVALEENFNKARHDVRDLISSTDQVYRRAETISNTRRALAEGAHDRAPRKYPAMREESEAIEPPPAAEFTERIERHDDPDLWEDNHSEADDHAPFPLR